MRVTFIYLLSPFYFVAAAEKLASSKTWWIQREIEFKLPPVKQFGRKRDHLSGLGWGRYHNGVFKPLQIENYQDGNPTKKFTEKLRQSFYDAKRLEEFRAMQEGRILTKESKVSKLDEKVDSDDEEEL